MKLHEIIKAIPDPVISGPTDIPISTLEFDSRRVKKGALFFALSGEKVDGAKFIPEVLAKGAAAVIAEKDADWGAATGIVVKDARQAMAAASAEYYKHPSREMLMFGVTGTNGKTTTTFIIRHIVSAAMMRCGLIGTIQYQIGDEILPSSHTTPESLDLQELLARMADQHCHCVSMEVSSHALAQRRVHAIEFDAAVFTNLTQDHLDYHKTMESYFQTKAGLFFGLIEDRTKASKPRAVINVDDRFGQRLADMMRERGFEPLTYGMSLRADFRATDVRSDFNGTTYTLEARGKQLLVRMPLVGMFNVYNSLAALAASTITPIPLRDAVISLADLPPVPGRLEIVPGNRRFNAYVDYAHTDDALINALKTLRGLKPRKIIVVFGCGGDRDKSKRPKMGAAVEAHADYAIVTSDNPRSENPAKIIADIRVGMPRGNYEVILDRREAIIRAVSLAQPRDILLIAGKGHEDYQEFENKRREKFDDVAVTRAAMASLRMEAPMRNERPPRDEFFHPRRRPEEGNFE